MKRLTVVDLAGRAQHVDEAGAAALDEWFAEAGARLAGDPDRDELLLDFERAIADKLSSSGHDERSVVSHEEIARVLESLGTVEPVGGDEPAAGSEADTEALPAVSTAAPDDSWRARKLYRIDGDEAMIAGVCAGVAAYLRVDVTVVRVAAVLLALVTGGGLIIAYLVLWAVLPAASTPEERAAAHGFGATAQDLVARARSNAAPALSGLGRVLERVLHAFAGLAYGVFLLAAALTVAAWVVGVVWVFADAEHAMRPFADGTPTWLAALLVSCLALTVLIPLAGLAALARMLTGRPRQASRSGLVRSMPLVGAFVWIVVVAGALAITWGASPQLRHVSDDGKGRLEMPWQDYCFIESSSRPSGEARCQPGDEIVDTSDDDPYDAYDDDDRYDD